MSIPQRTLLTIITIIFVSLSFFHLSSAKDVSANKAALDKARGGLITSARKAQLTKDTKDNKTNAGAEVRTIITKVVGYILAMVGVILLVQVVFAGYSWMMSGGNEETIKKAKGKIVNAVIGLAIILVAYILVNAIFGLLYNVTNNSS